MMLLPCLTYSTRLQASSSTTEEKEEDAYVCYLARLGLVSNSAGQISGQLVNWHETVTGIVVVLFIGQRVVPAGQAEPAAVDFDVQLAG